MGETNGSPESRVVILLRDGRALQAAERLTPGMALLIRNDLRYWLVGSRSVDYIDPEGTVCRLRAEEVSGIEVLESEDA